MKRFFVIGVVILASLALSVSVPHAQDTAPNNPAAYSVTQLPTNIRYGGRAVAVAVNPLSSNEAMVASESGGLFRTTNSGTSWSHIDSLSMFRLRDVKYHPVTLQGSPVLFVSGWANGHWSSNEGGLWRSLDDGATWEHTWSNPYNTSTNCNYPVTTHGIGLDPTSGLVVVGNDCGLSISQDYGTTWNHVYTDTVISVSVQYGPIIDICTNRGHKRAGPDLKFGNYTTTAGKCTSTHGITTSPNEANVVYLATFVNNPAGCDVRTRRASVLMEGAFDDTLGSFVWRNATPTMCFGGGRSPWVATYPSRDHNGNHYDVYFGDAERLWRNTCTAGGSGARCNSSNWTQVTVDHADQNHIAFDSTTFCAQYLLSDGGIHRATDATNQATCGSNWVISGTAANGYNALQIYDVAGTNYTNHVRLYIGTQDNGLWYSPDGGLTWPRGTGNEGFFLQAPLQAVTPSNERVTFADPGERRNRIALSDFTTTQLWNDPLPHTVGSPYLLDSSVYLQYNRPYTNTNGVRVTIDRGGSWFSYNSFIADMMGRGQVSFAGDHMNFYQGFRYPTDVRPRDLKQGLFRLYGISRSGFPDLLPMIAQADTNNLGSIGNYPMGEGTFVWHSVFGVDPLNPNHLFAADIVNNQMMESRNGGIDWTSNMTLTYKVTGVPSGSPHYMFFLDGTQNPPYGIIPGARLQPHVIAFDPFIRNHILVGTENVGVIESWDGGAWWTILPNTSQIPAITSFFFERPVEGTNQSAFYVSSYGRGLWKIVSPRVVRVYLMPDALAARWQTGVIYDTLTADNIDIYAFDDPFFCPGCEFYTLARNYITDILINEGVVEQIKIDGGRLVGSDQEGNPLELDIPTVIDEADGTFEGCNACQEVVNLGGLVRGVIIGYGGTHRGSSPNTGSLFAIIASFGDLPNADVIEAFDANPEEPPAGSELPIFTDPYILAGSNYLYGDQSAVANGEALEITGYNWKTDPGCGAVNLVLDESTMLLAGIVPDGWGNFEVHPVIEGESGFHYLTASQVCGETTYYDAQWLMVIIKEEWWESLIYLPVALR